MKPVEEDLKVLTIDAMYVYIHAMATKTISIDLEAYEALRKARQHPKESFSQVIMRARWRDEMRTGRALLAALDDMPFPDESTLERLEAAQSADMSPEDP